MGHTHKYGRSYKVWKRLSNGQKGELIYDASCPLGIPGCPTQFFDYRHIPLRYWEPLLPLKWSNGLIHEATWVNDGPAAVNFGPTSDDEMMVLIAFYTLAPLTVSAGEPVDEAAGRAVFISPNPASGTTTFLIPGATGVREFRLFDLAGREVLRRSDLAGSSFELDLSSLQPGIYLFHADGRSGKLVVE